MKVNNIEMTWHEMATKAKEIGCKKEFNLFNNRDKQFICAFLKAQGFTLAT
jgi:hypothetical protein